MKKNPITYTHIKTFLTKCCFNPRSAGPLAIISDINNPNYYEQRAVEFIREAAKSVEDDTLDRYDDMIIKAIRLLALANLSRHNTENESKSI